MARKLRSIAGRPAMITGAASGIGRSLARRLSRSGSPVAVADIDEAGLKDTAKSLPGPVLVRVLDVRDAADQQRFAADFEALLRTTPDKAAEIICRGVDRGKARILVGPDAYVFDTLTRVTPTHYYDVMAVLEKRLRAAR